MALAVADLIYQRFPTNLQILFALQKGWDGSRVKEFLIDQPLVTEVEWDQVTHKSITSILVEFTRIYPISGEVSGIARGRHHFR